MSLPQQQVQWECKLDDGTWTSYSPDTVAAIDAAYQSKATATFQLGQYSYEIDFGHAEPKQRNTTTNANREIRR